MKENNEPIIVEISDIVEMTKHCEFFKKLNEEQGDEKIHHACCKAMKIEEYNPNDIIIKYGEPAACFYVVIDGKVSVRIPSKQKTLNHFNFIDSLNKDPFKKKLKFVPNHFDEKIGVSLLSTLLNFHGQYFEEVSVLGPGDVFGELAILSEKPRAATVQAKTKVVLGVLSKGAFQKLIGAFTEKKLNEKIEFLQSLSLFKSWSRLFLMRISFYFSYKKLSWNQILYKEGSPSNSIYFIKEGDIMVWVI
jgi:CRP-like cAMP-binding protein